MYIVLEAALIQLATECSPQLPIPLVVAVARQESGLNEYAIGNPTIKSQPQDFSAALSIQAKLTQTNSRYDAGLMQISSANFKWLGLTPKSVLNPCTNLAAAQKVLLHGLSIGDANIKQVTDSISRYNTGNAAFGYKNGYVSGVVSKLLQNPLPSTFSDNKESDNWSKLGATHDLFSTSEYETNVANKRNTAQNNQSHYFERINNGKGTESKINQIQGLDKSNREGLSFVDSPNRDRTGKLSMLNQSDRSSLW